MEKFALSFCRLACNNCPVSLVHAAVAEHLVHALECLGGLGKNYNPAHGPVKSVRNTYKGFAGFLVTHCNKACNLFAQRLISCLVALHNLPCPFVYNNQVIILKENLKVKSLRLHAARFKVVNFNICMLTLCTANYFLHRLKRFISIALFH